MIRVEKNDFRQIWEVSQAGIKQSRVVLVIVEVKVFSAILSGRQKCRRIAKIQWEINVK